MKFDSTFKFAYLFVALALCVYFILRAILIGITYDEAWTLDGSVNLKVIEVLNYKDPSTNNHILNTLLIKLLFLVGKKSVFIARIPNILAGVLYVYFSYKISLDLVKRTLALPLFLLLLLNPFLVEFFSLARGYGLSLGFLLGSIYYLFNLLKTYNTKNACLTLAFGCLSVISNFTLLNYLVGLLICLLIVLIVNKKTALPSIKFLVLILVTFVLIIYEPIRKIIKHNQIGYGGSSNIYEDTLISLTSFTLGHDYDTRIAEWVLPIFLLCMGILVVFKSRSKDVSQNMKQLLSFLLMISPLVSTIILFYLFNSHYLIDRTALFLYPLIIIFISTLSQEDNTKYRELIQGGVLYFLALSMSINFLLNMNLYKTISWFQDAHTFEVLKTINDKGSKENRIISFASAWPFRSSIVYYQRRSVFENLIYIENTTENPNAINTSNVEYYLFLNKDLPPVGYWKDNHFRDYSCDTITQYKKEGVILLGDCRK